MSKPLSNLDYLFESAKTKQSDASQSSSSASANSEMHKATAAFGGLILDHLKRMGGHSTAFKLVDATGIPLQTAFQVLDDLASPQFRWIDVVKSDPKGDYQIDLRQEGKDALK